MLYTYFEVIGKMKLYWYGHSCFQIESGGFSAVFDPYQDGSVAGLPPLRLTADAVYCSHDHHDHNARQLVTLTGRSCPLSVETVSCFHDDKLGLLRGKNTIHILSAEGMRVAHLGDIGHMLSGKKLAALQGVDALLIPVGGYYTIDAPTAKRLADAIAPRVVIPMHYRLGGVGLEVIAGLGDFTGLCGDVHYYEGNAFELGPDTPAQTAVLSYGK